MGKFLEAVWKLITDKDGKTTNEVFNAETPADQLTGGALERGVVFVREQTQEGVADKAKTVNGDSSQLDAKRAARLDRHAQIRSAIDKPIKGNVDLTEEEQSELSILKSNNDFDGIRALTERIKLRVKRSQINMMRSRR